MKKNPAMIYQGQGKFIITATGDMTKMLFIGKNYLEHKIKGYNVGKQDQTRLMYTILCLQIASTGYFLKMETEFCSKDSQHLELHQGYLSEADGNRSSSHSDSSRNNYHLRALQPVLGN